MGGIDYVVIFGYLIFLLLVGVYFSRKASKDADHYFLGGRRLPWWCLGASGMSSNLDVAGTMTIVTLLYLFGLHGFFIEMRGGVVLPIAVFLAFMGKWHQRSQVMTTAEWMELRFGSDASGKLARTTAALTYVVITIGMVVFFLSAMGKFLAVFLPFTELQCQVGMLLVALGYTAMSGLYGVVWTDVFQAFLIGAAAIYVAVIGALEMGPELVAQWPGAQWNQAIPRWYDAGLTVSQGDSVLDYRWFGFFLLAWMGKGILEGLGGSGGSAYMSQRFYAARDERDCAKIGMLWTVLFAFRWPMVLGFVILAIALGVGQGNPETILPEVILSDYFPPGVRGLVVAAMLAAAMSTFDSTINAGASYLVRDVYGVMRRSATSRELIWASYLSSAVIVFVGLGLALQVKSVVGVWVAIVINLFPAFLMPFALRWFWGSFNGVGFASGVGMGFATSLWLFCYPEWSGGHELVTLSAILGVSTVGCFLGTWLGPNVSRDRLNAFYQQVRPFGWWPREWKKAYRSEHQQDLHRLGVALIWQITTFLIPMVCMLHLWGSAMFLMGVWGIASFWLFRRVFLLAERSSK